MDFARNGDANGTISAAAADLSSSSLVLLLLGGVLVTFLLGSYESKRRQNLPPGPRNWPIIGALLEMGPQMHKVYEKMAAKYGPIVHFRLGVQTVVLVSSADAAKEVLKTRDAMFADRSTAMTRSAAKYVGFNSTNFAFANYDTQLKLLRKISFMQFFTGAKLKLYEELRNQEVAVMVEKIFNEHGSSKDNVAKVGIRAVTGDVMANIMFSLIFGKRFDGLLPTDLLLKIPKIVEDRAQLFMNFNLLDFFPVLERLDPQGMLKAFEKLGERHEELYGGIIAERRQERKLNRISNNLSNSDEENVDCNFLDALITAQDEGASITDDGVKGTLTGILAASTETTSIEVEWVLLELVRHPEMLQRLQAEIDAVVGKERPVQEADLQAMPYLNAVVTEALRLHPSLPFTFPHVNAERSTLCGYNIPPQSAVILNIYSIGRDPKVWKDPLQFNPERFMPGGSSTDSSSPSETIKANGSDYRLLPFSSGRRSCIGYNLAIVLLRRIVASLVHAFEWTPLPGTSKEDMNTDEGGSFTLHSASTLVLASRPRLSRNVYLLQSSIA